MERVVSGASMMEASKYGQKQEKMHDQRAEWTQSHIDSIQKDIFYESDFHTRLITSLSDWENDFREKQIKSLWTIIEWIVLSTSRTSVIFFNLKLKKGHFEWNFKWKWNLVSVLQSIVIQGEPEIFFINEARTNIHFLGSIIVYHIVHQKCGKSENFREIFYTVVHFQKIITF